MHVTLRTAGDAGGGGSSQPPLPGGTVILLFDWSDTHNVGLYDRDLTPDQATIDTDSRSQDGLTSTGTPMHGGATDVFSRGRSVSGYEVLDVRHREAAPFGTAGPDADGSWGSFADLNDPPGATGDGGKEYLYVGKLDELPPWSMVFGFLGDYWNEGWWVTRYSDDDGPTRAAAVAALDAQWNL